MATSLALAAMSILVIGDSHMTAPTYLPTSLHDALMAKGAQVHTIGVCGSKPTDWLKATPGNCGGSERVGAARATSSSGHATTRSIPEIIAQDKPNLVVIVMGDTIGGYSTPVFPKVWIGQQVTSLTKAIAATGTQCVWVGPPWGGEGGKYMRTFSRVKELSAFLSQNVAPCAYINSLEFSKPGEWATIDGQHLTVPYYQRWGADIAEQLVTLPVVQQAAQSAQSGK